MDQAGVLPENRPSALEDRDIKFLLKQAERVVDAQWESADRLANRASTLIGVGVSILTGVLIVAATNRSAIPGWIAASAGILVLGSAVTASLAYFATGANYPPNPTKIIVKAANLESDVKLELLDVKWLLLKNLAEAHEQDATLTETRGAFVNVSLALFVAAVFIIIGGVVAYLL
jgi:hypothetical protein